MARPVHRPRPPPFKRVCSPLIRFKEEIEDLYLVKTWGVAKIIHHISQHHGVVQSPKQYKKQLSEWGFRRYFTLRDAAFVLRLLNQARDQGRREVVLYSGHRKYRHDIIKYIQRRNPPLNETELLAQISDQDETPRFIRPDFQPATVLHTPPSTGSSDSGLAEVPPMRVPIPSPEVSPRHSSEWSSEPRHVPRCRGSSPEADEMETDPDLVRMRSQETLDTCQPDIHRVLAPFQFPHQEPPPSFWLYPQSSEPNTHLPAGWTDAMLSATPASMGGLGFDDSRFGDHTRSAQLNDDSPSAKFVQYCLYWLICVGQEDAQCQQDAIYHMDMAKWFFLNTIQAGDTPGEACLGALSVVTTLFDCYGHSERLIEMLTCCDEVSKKHLGFDNALAMTIAFMKNMLDHSQGSSPRHDLEQLRQVCVRIQYDYPRSPAPWLTARYNLAWAMMENELKKDQTQRNFYPAKRELEELTRLCEAHLGPCRIESIMAAATLARATMQSGEGNRAEEIIADVVLPRVRENFPEDHPYTWEAKHRHAFLLYDLSRREPTSNSRSRLQQSEQLLREVVPHRQRILGESNPKTAHSFLLLKKVLEKQGKTGEANSLEKWCQLQLRG